MDTFGCHYYHFHGVCCLFRLKQHDLCLFLSNADTIAGSRMVGVKCGPHSPADWTVKCGSSPICRLLHISMPKSIPKPGFYGVKKPKPKPSPKLHNLPTLVTTCETDTPQWDNTNEAIKSKFDTIDILLIVLVSCLMYFWCWSVPLKCKFDWFRNVICLWLQRMLVLLIFNYSFSLFDRLYQIDQIIQLTLKSRR